MTNWTIESAKGNLMDIRLKFDHPEFISMHQVSSLFPLTCRLTPDCFLL